ncbi:hypothetical protein C8F04DRAFT_1271342 [Mycena alexandri]|uniref:Metallo-beta-lactamase domain-containing protein n=1 Tax=Mycena alexandri TaxID=1745969 RepID=A0AAD6S9T0_9AGAR|nr:hypothetical protein C8F04DRAFT_1271342 [Mycena alexandri]
MPFILALGCASTRPSLHIYPYVFSLIPPCVCIIPRNPALQQAAQSGSSSAPLPVGTGHQLFPFPIFTFLVTHAPSGRRVLFDLGVLENTTPAVAEIVRAGLIVMPVARDFVEQLGDYGWRRRVSARRFGTMRTPTIWFVGDVSKFPGWTDLVFGNGTPCECHPHAMLDPVGRKLVPIACDESLLQIGGLKARDYFGDGSLYLLDVPGFIFLSGDAAHHAGMLRPTAALHRAFPPALLDATKPSVALTAIAPAASNTTDTDTSTPFDLAARTTPVLNADGGYYQDAPTPHASIALIGAFDANPDVLVVLAHDESLLDIVGPEFPAKLDGWKEAGWKERAVWASLEEGNAAFRFGGGGEGIGWTAT